jgi:iron complex outermembrane receptor protein
MRRRSNRYRPLARAISGILCATGALAPLSFELYAQEATETSSGYDPSLEVVTVTADPLRALGTGPSDSSFGFAKSLLETPRSVSVISEQQINLFGISTVDDLTRLIPGTFTNTRYGLQGGVMVRGVPSDMYYRGMKRLQMQGHVRTVLSAMDGIEVIKGPPSPIFGMGRIGGYQNLVPKSSRASNGAYMSDYSGFVQTTQGSYDRNEIQGGFGGPFNPGNKQGGFYVFGLFEDSDTYTKQVGVRQEFFQGTVAIEDAIGNFRLEFGGQAQQSITSGALFSRVTQDLVDNGRYIRGQPMVDLDLNGDGRIGIVELYTASPVAGTISTANQALNQRFAWPTDPETGQPIASVQDFPKVPGIPAAMLAYLNAHPEIDCHAANVMRSMPAGGPLPISGMLPVGMVLDPCTVSYSEPDYRGNGAFEREQNANQRLAFFDLINDKNENFTMKNQFLYDNINSFKDSWQPYGEQQYIKAVEDKFTITKRISDENLPDWVRINMLASLNYRKTSGWIRSSGGDYNWRQDIFYNGGYSYPNTMFWTQLTNPDYATGAPDTRWLSSEQDNAGLGVMFDIDLFQNTNIILGGRYDQTDARATEMPTFTELAGESPAPGTVCTAPGPGCPGRFLGTETTVYNSDSGRSWSISISQQIGDRWRPYITAAESSLLLASSNDLVQASIVRGGNLVGTAELKEVGIKGAFFNDTLQWSTSLYEQTRIDITSPEDPSDAADVSSSVTRGVETEIRWVPSRNFFLSFYLLNQYSELLFDTTANLQLSARDLGFMDVIDPATGAVLYPAEAFFYGGKASVVLPANLEGYRERPGQPETQAGLNLNYTFPNGFGVIFGATYHSEAWADRLKTVNFPGTTVYNAGFTFEKNLWNMRVNGYNVTDEHYFRAGIFGAPGAASVMPGRRWEFTARREFD